MNLRLKRYPVHWLVGGVLLFLLLGLASAPLNTSLLARVNLMLYDLLLPVQAPPMSGDITVVAIDDRSVEALGRWPWSRRYHAQLIEVLNASGARVIGMDLLFSEPDLDDPEADLRLARAVDAATVVLPVAPFRRSQRDLIDELMPLPALAAAADGIAQVDVELDIDGLCRSVFLYGGVGDARWASLALAMLSVDGNVLVEGYAAPAGGSASAAWVRADRRLIPFTRPAQEPRTVSFSDVIGGRVDRAAIADRYVLVGATATGLGDAISTPGARSHERMPGVVLNAQVLNGLLQGRMIRTLSPGSRVPLTLALVAAVVIAVQAVSPRAGALVTLVGIASILAISAVLLAARQLWFPPASSLLAVLLAWPTWVAWQYQRSQQLTARLLRQLDHQSRHQISTGLPNHGMLLDRLRRLADDTAAPGMTALLVIHINWPGSAGIVLDRPISDPVLRSIRDRIREIAGPEAFIAHLSSDDFAVLTSGYADEAAAGEAASAFLAQMQLPMAFRDEHLLLTPKVGVSLWPTPDHEAPEQLLRNAYTALFKSRIDDAEQLSVYSGAASDRLHTRSLLEQSLAFALERSEFTVHYQPQVSADDGRVIGAEALLRWNNPILGWVNPGSFVPVAEQVGLIRSIGAWVIEDACRQLNEWRSLGFEELRLAINVSPLQFLVPGLENDVQDIVDRVGIPPGRVELEITESSLMHDLENAIRVMHRIKDFGLELAIDDFGTGYSSLSNLRDFPLDRLKVDQAFVMEIGLSVYAERITHTIIAMGRHLGLSIVAEGVETEAQAEFLRNEGCDVFQGFLYGRPMPAEDFTRMLLDTRDAPA